MTVGWCAQAAKRKSPGWWFEESGDDRARDASRAQTASMAIALALCGRATPLVAKGSAAERRSKTIGFTAAVLGDLTAAGGQLPDSRA